MSCCGPNSRRNIQPSQAFDRPTLPVVTEVPAKLASYVPIVAQIAEAAEKHSRAYERLEELCVRFGHRISGSENLERAIDWLVQTIRQDGFDHVKTESVMVPNWVRGRAAGYILSPQLPAQQQTPDATQSHGLISSTPVNQQMHKVSEPLLRYGDRSFDFSRARPLHLLAIGQSCSTPAEGLTAEVVEVAHFEALEALLKADPNAVRGKVVFYNCIFTDYGNTVRHRSRGALVASKHGAVATLVRSVGPVSLYTPHTGSSEYAPIPAFCIPLEDAELLSRLGKICKPAEPLIVHLYSSAKNNPPRESRNVIAEIRGSVYPDEYVVIGAHIDSWDIGQGAHDDGQGVFVAYETIRLLKVLGLTPRRTIRFVAFTDEENRNSGGHAYLQNHLNEMDKIVACMETDVGCFTAIGFAFTGSKEAKKEVEQISSLFTKAPFNAGVVCEEEEGGVDVDPMICHGVPGLLLQLDYQWFDNEYFQYHHTQADTIDKIDPKMLIQNVQLFASMAYVLADMEPKLARSPLRTVEPRDLIAPECKDCTH